jgi:hypothetical protein
MRACCWLDGTSWCCGGGRDADRRPRRPDHRAGGHPGHRRGQRGRALPGRTCHPNFRDHPWRQARRDEPAPEEDPPHPRHARVIQGRPPLRRPSQLGLGPGQALLGQQAHVHARARAVAPSGIAPGLAAIQGASQVTPEVQSVASPRAAWIRSARTMARGSGLPAWARVKVSWRVTSFKAVAVPLSSWTSAQGTRSPRRRERRPSRVTVIPPVRSWGRIHSPTRAQTATKAHPGPGARKTVAVSVSDRTI